MVAKTAKIKFVAQREECESGLAAILMIANYYGHDFDLSTLRRRYPGVGTRGMTLKDIMGVASDLQLGTRVLKTNPEGLLGVGLPSILPWSRNQFVILLGRQKEGFLILHPSLGMQLVDFKTFFGHFQGVVLECLPIKTFRPESGRTILKLSMIAGNVQGLWKSAGFLIVICSAIFMLTFVMPFYSILVMDEAVNSRDMTLLMQVMIAALIIGCLQGATEYFRDRLVLYLGTQFTFQSNVNLIAHLLKLPMSYFETRHAADIMSRVGALDEIKRTLTENLVRSLIDIVILFSVLGLLFIYSWQLSAIVLGFAGISATWRLLLIRRSIAYAGDTLAAKAREDASLLETVRGIQSIKLYGIENERFNVWNLAFTKKLNASLRSSMLGTWWIGLDRLGKSMETAIILAVGAYQVIGNNLTLGVLICFISYKDKFVEKYLEFLEQAVSFAKVKLHLERLSDVLLHNREEETFSGTQRELTGELEVRNMSFRYSANEPYLFKSLNLQVEAGEAIAITGPSGVGKSTLMKILLGLIEPHSGDIAVDGLSIKQHRFHFRKGIATVMQDDCILTGSIEENIAFFDTELVEARVIQCAQAACIHEDVMDMALGYKTQISDYSSSISGGQKQRILIARALYRQPKILFMDEATSALDVQNEKKVNSTLKEMGVTRIIIAHRLETINSADRIYDLKDGALKERGRNEIAGAS